MVAKIKLVDSLERPKSVKILLAKISAPRVYDVSNCDVKTFNFTFGFQSIPRHIKIRCLQPGQRRAILTNAFL